MESGVGSQGSVPIIVVEALEAYGALIYLRPNAHK